MCQNKIELPHWSCLLEGYFCSVHRPYKVLSHRLCPLVLKDWCPSDSKETGESHNWPPLLSEELSTKTLCIFLSCRAPHSAFTQWPVESYSLLLCFYGFLSIEFVEKNHQHYKVWDYTVPGGNIHILLDFKHRHHYLLLQNKPPQT